MIDTMPVCPDCKDESDIETFEKSASDESNSSLDWETCDDCGEPFIP